MSEEILHPDIVKTLGIEELPPDAQATFLAEIGDTILETALVRFAAILSEPQHTALQDYLETDPEPDVLLAHLAEHYQEFKDILAAVAEEFRADAQEVLPTDAE